MTFDGFDSRAARLEMNARAYQYDARLEQLADLRAADFDAFMKRVGGTSALGEVEIYADFRDHYRRAVAAGVVRDDRGPSAA